MIILKPYSTMLNFFVELFNDLSVTLVLMQYLLLSDGNQFTELQSRNYIGWGVVASIILNTLVNNCIIMYEGIMEIKRRIVRFIKRRKMIAEVVKLKP